MTVQPEPVVRRRTTWPAAVPLQQAADAARRGAANLGPLAEPIGDLLDEFANALAWLAPYREHEGGHGMWETAMRVANTINSEAASARPEPAEVDRCPVCVCEDCGHPLAQHTPGGCGGEDCADPEYACNLTCFMSPARIGYLAQALGPLLSAHLGARQQQRCFAVAHAAHHALDAYDYPNGDRR